MRAPYTAADIQFMSRLWAQQAVRIARGRRTHGAIAQWDTGCAQHKCSEDEIRPAAVAARPPAAVPIPTSGSHSRRARCDARNAAAAQCSSWRCTRARRPALLSLMIQHHSGAVEMVKDLFGSYGAAQDETVFKFASDVNVDQSTEIERMEKMLAALPPTTQP